MGHMIIAASAAERKQMTIINVYFEYKYVSPLFPAIS
jgi:hypothetical protein